MLLLTRLFFATALFALMIIIKSWQLPFVTSLQYRVFDLYQTIKPRPYEPAPVRIVDLDEETLSRLGQWPWPRTRVAELVQKLHHAGAAAIAFDIVFAEPDRTSPDEILKVWQRSPALEQALAPIPDGDGTLEATLHGKPVITSFVLTHDPAKNIAPLPKPGFAVAGGTPMLSSFSGAVLTLPALEKAATGNGAMNSDPDDDGILRRVPLVLQMNGQMFPSLMAESLRIAQSASSVTIKTLSPAAGDENKPQPVTAVRIGEVVIPTDERGKMWVYYTPFEPGRYLPAWKVMDGSAGEQDIAGNIILIGTSAQGLKDIRTTPLNPVLPGVEVHAQAIEQAILGVNLLRPDWIFGAEVLAMIATAGLTILAAAFLPAMAGGFVLVTLIAATFGASFYLFSEYRILAEPVMACATMMIGYFNESLSRNSRIERDRARVRVAFSHYMAPELVEDLARHPENLVLGGETRELTVMFSDVRGFSAIAEKLSPEALTSLLNQLLTPMTDAILSEKGTIDKYIGDCIMAFWNAPLDVPHHPSHAGRAALKMLAAIEALNTARAHQAASRRQPFAPLKIGVGINTGLCCVGNMGSAQRFSYSALGDEVNLASRLEGQCKIYGVELIIGESTARQLSGFALLELDLLRVQGKEEVLRIYTLVGDETMAQMNDFKTWERHHNAMLEAYRRRDWPQALHHIELSLKGAEQTPCPVSMHKYYALFQKRISDFSHTPPPPEWDGIHTAESK